MKFPDFPWLRPFVSVAFSLTVTVETLIIVEVSLVSQPNPKRISTTNHRCTKGSFGSTNLDLPRCLSELYKFTPSLRGLIFVFFQKRGRRGQKRLLVYGDEGDVGSQEPHTFSALGLANHIHIKKQKCGTATKPNLQHWPWPQNQTQHVYEVPHVKFNVDWLNETHVKFNVDWLNETQVINLKGPPPVWHPLRETGPPLAH